ncbi:MAG: hypothetical protein U1D55_00700 [Phycisphaerae bacterium]
MNALPHRRAAVRCFAALAVVLICGLATILNQSAVHWRDDLADSHLFAYYGWRVANGATPYLDTWDNKPPGIIWLNALAALLFDDPLGEIACCAVAVFAGILAFVGTARAVFHPSLTPLACLAAAVGLTQLRFECGANRTETFVAASELLAVLAYMRGVRNGNRLLILLGGLFAGAAPVFKQAGVAAFVACAADTALRSWTARTRNSTAKQNRRARSQFDLVALLVGALIAPITSAAALASQGALGEAWFAAISFNRAYFAVGDAGVMRLFDALARYAPHLRALSGVTALAIAGAVLWFMRSSAPEPPRGMPVDASTSGGVPRFEPRGLVLLVVWLLTSLFLAFVGPGRLAYHLAPSLAPLGLLSLCPLHELVRHTGLLRSATSRPSVAVAVTLFIAIWSGIEAENLALSRTAWHAKPTWWSLARIEPTDEQNRGESIQRLIGPDDAIYVFGWSPGTYRYARRPAASRFATSEKMGQVGVHAAFIGAAIRLDLRDHPPALIALSDADRERMRANEPDFASWIETHYRSIGDVHGMPMLIRASR